MKSLRFIAAIICAAALLSSCNPTVNSSIKKYYAPLPVGSAVEVHTMQEHVPEGAELVGHVKVDESGFTTKCSYDYVVHCAQEAARKSGADLIHIIEHKTPNFWSTCHRIEAAMYIKPIAVPESDSYWSNNVVDTLQQKSSIEPGRESGSDTAQKSNATGTTSQILNPDSTRTSGSTPQGGREVQPMPIPYTKDIDASGNVSYGPRPGAATRISMSAGYSRRLSPIADNVPNDLRDYLNGLRNGYHFGGEVAFRVSDGVYLGPRFDRFRASNSMLVSIDNGANAPIIGEVRETVVINYVALQVTQMYSIGEGGSSAFLAYSVGYMHYNNSGIIPVEVAPESYALLPIALNGGNLGLRMGGGFDISLSETTKFSLGLGFATSSIRNFDVTIAGNTFRDERERDNAEGLLRMDLGAGITWLF